MDGERRIAARRLVDVTASGPPASGAFQAGDFVANTGNIWGWVCIADGEPGVWAPIERAELDPASGTTALVYRTRGTAEGPPPREPWMSDADYERFCRRARAG